jgi:outer membrane cobalamin receptor
MTMGVRDERPQVFAHTVVPSVGAIYTVAGKDEGFRANYGRAFRIPALEETSPLFFGNPSLQPEYGATFDVGAFRGADCITYFGTRASNLIVSEPPLFLPVNVSLADIRGFNVHAQRLLPRGASLLIDYTDYLRAADVIDGNRLPYRPTATGSIQFVAGRGALAWGVLARYVGRRFADDPNVTLLPQYAALGAYVSRRVGASSLALRFDNITGERVEEVPGYPTLGPSMSLTIATSWFQ